jgi:hypothetical protein
MSTKKKPVAKAKTEEVIEAPLEIPVVNPMARYLGSNGHLKENFDAELFSLEGKKIPPTIVYDVLRFQKAFQEVATSLFWFGGKENKVLQETIFELAETFHSTIAKVSEQQRNR